jgi:hypothetical protein
MTSRLAKTVLFALLGGLLCACASNIALQTAPTMIPTSEPTTALVTSASITTDLFFDAPAPASITPDPLVVRSRWVTLNSELLNGLDAPPNSSASAKSVRLNLFPEATFTALPDRVDPNPNGFTWFGHAQDVAQSKVTLVMNNGVLAGTIRASGHFFQIRLISGTTYAIQEINPKAFPPD